MAAKKKAGAKPKKAARKRAPARIGRAHLAELLAVNPSTVDQWRRRGVPMQETESGGRFLVSEVVEWLRERDIEATIKEHGRDDSVIDIQDLRNRRLQADTELAELALEEARGEVLPREIVLELTGESLLRVRARLLAMKGRFCGPWARIKTAAKMKAAIAEATNEILGELVDAESVAAEAEAAGRMARSGRPAVSPRSIRRGRKEPSSAAD